MKLKLYTDIKSDLLQLKSKGRIKIHKKTRKIQMELKYKLMIILFVVLSYAIMIGSVLIETLR